MSDTKEGFDIHPVSYFPALEDLYEKPYSDNKYENVIGLRLMYTPSLYFGLMCFFMLLACQKKQKELLLMIYAFAARPFIVTLNSRGFTQIFSSLRREPPLQTRRPL